MKTIPVQETRPGDVFFHQSFGQPIRAWIRIALPKEQERKTIMAESYFSHEGMKSPGKYLHLSRLTSVLVCTAGSAFEIPSDYLEQAVAALERVAGGLLAETDDDPVWRLLLMRIAGDV